MSRQSHRVSFQGHNGITLSGVLESPSATPNGYILFSHCFTCNKDLKAIVRISRALAERGWAVLRYDFAGLGNSHGRFEDTNFTTNCEDLRAATAYLASHHAAPHFLMGHSFGGAASFAMAESIASVHGVIGLAAPCDTRHLANLLVRMSPAIVSEGSGRVTIGGVEYTILKQMIDDFQSHDLAAAVAKIQKSMLLFHSKTDETVGFNHAIQNAGLSMDGLASNRSLIALPGSNHLLTNHERDIAYVASIVDAWCRRHLA